MITTVGQVMVNEALPEDLRDYSRTLSKKDADAMLTNVIKLGPEKYRDISHKLVQLGREAAFTEGTTLRLSDLHTPVDKATALTKMRVQESRINKSKLTDAERESALEDLYNNTQHALSEATYDLASAKENPFAMQVKSQARGNKMQLAALMTSPGVYHDAQDRMIPVYINRSYAEGLEPHEYWAASYGARKGVVSTKFSTREGGYLGKLMGTAAMTQVVTDDDCGTPYGVPVKADDTDNLGAVLARPAAGYSAGTVINRDVLAGLKNKNESDIVVRSPLTCALPKGLCKRCVGIRENGEFPEIGYHAGLNAASALAERVAQGALNTRHTGGQKSKDPNARATYAGFDMLKNLATVPSTYPDRAVVAEEAGRINSIKPAPQGGSMISVGSQEYHVPDGYPLIVKEGDDLEAGDALSDGIVNPADMVRLKGIGEGRRYFANRFTQAFKESDYGANRRNVEVLGRAIVDHVSVTDDAMENSYLPGEIVSYNAMAHGYKPRKDAQTLAPSKALGQYMEAPALHYTIGTPITKSVSANLSKFGVESVLAHPKPVGFEPSMQSVVKTPEFSDDWIGRLGSSYLKTRLLEDAQTGATSEVHGIHPLPGIAKGTEFGESRKDRFTY